MSDPKAKLIVTSSFRTRKRIIVKCEQGDDKLYVNSTENARAAYQRTLDALLPVFLRIMGLPEEWAVNARIRGVIFGEVGDVDTASLTAEKYLDGASKACKITTPPRLLQKSTTPGTTGDAVSPEDEELISDHRAAAKDYFKGERAQGLLPGIGGNGSDDDDDAGGGESPKGKDDPNQLKFPGGEPSDPPTPGQGQDGPPAEKKKRGPYKKKPKA